MTERGRTHVEREQTLFRVGPSQLRWQGDEIVVDFAEISVPRPPAQWLPKPIKGSITFRPQAITEKVFDIDAKGHQRWWPIAPLGRVSVDLSHSGLKWEGHGYLDSNWGTEPLEKAFINWDWARGTMPSGESIILYDSIRRDGTDECLALAISPKGEINHLEKPQVSALPAGFWGVKRRGHHDRDEKPQVLQTLEDGPFYTRSIVRTVLGGRGVDLMHESLSGDRFASPLVKMMLPFRMPRRR